MMKKDYYDVLGVSRAADAAAIKKAYKRLTEKYHPDSNVGNVQTEECLKELSGAYDILGGEKQWELYDQYEHAAFDETAGAYGDTEGNGSGNDPHYIYGDMSNDYRECHFEGGKDMGGILEHIFGGSGVFHRGTANEFRGNRFNETYPRHGFPGKGTDIQSSIEVSFDEAVLGCKKIIRLQDENGQIQSMEVTIPAGIADDKITRLKEKGMDGTSGGEPGNLPLNMTIRGKLRSRRDGQNIYTAVTVPFVTTVLGGEVEISTIYGDVVYEIKAGTQPRSQIRLKGEDIVASENPTVHSNQYITVEVQVPKNLMPEAKQKLEEFGQFCNEAGKSIHGGYAA